MTNNPCIQIGRAISARREECQLTIKELATKAKMSENRLLQIELGKTNLRLTTLIQISKALDIKVYDVIKMIE